MTIPNETITKMQSLPSAKMSIVIDLVNQLSTSDPVDVFMSLCENGAENPMTEEEVSQFVSDVRKERNAAGH